MAPELQRAIDDAYRVFARYDLGGGIEVCHCPVCVAPEFERALNTTPLRDMSRELLAEYTASAHGWGSDKTANDLRYLLPRYFDLIAQARYPSFLDEDGCLSRLHIARPGRPTRSRRSTGSSSPCFGKPCSRRSTSANAAGASWASRASRPSCR
jgi:hypothetical protein